MLDNNRSYRIWSDACKIINHAFSMTTQELRDMFAAHALQGLVARDEKGGPPQYAEASYMYAEAMLAEREKTLKANEE